MNHPLYRAVSCFSIWLSAVLLGVLIATTASAQRIAISGTPASGSVSADYAVTPDGFNVVFIADRDAPGFNELYVVRIATGVITKLSVRAAGSGSVTSFKLSPNGQRVVYRGDLSTAGTFNLYSVAITGGTVAAFTGLTTAANVEFDYQISADSARIVFRGDLLTDNKIELFSAPIAGGPALAIASPAIASGDVFGFQISPDSTTVVAYGDLTTDSQFELYSVPIAGGALTPISGNIVANGDVYDFQISPDSTRVIFRGNLTQVGRIDLFTVSLSTLSRQTLSSSIAVQNPPEPPIPAGGNVEDFQISPNSDYVVFRGDLITDQRPELFSVWIAGGIRQTLSGTLTGVGSGVDSGYRISPDGNRAVFRARIANGGPIELFSAPIVDGARTPLSPPPVAGGNVGNFAISPDSSFVVYTGDLRTDGKAELFRFPIVGGNFSNPNRNLFIDSGPVVAGGNVEAFRISPEGSHVVFSGDLNVVGIYQLFSTRFSVGERVLISEANATNGDVYDFQITPDNLRVIFRGDLQADGVDELFRVQIDGAPRLLDFDGDDRVFSSSDLLMLARYQRGLRGTPLTLRALGATATVTSPTAIAARIAQALAAETRTAPPTQLFTGSVGSTLPRVALSPDGRYAVFTADNDANGSFELYSVRLSTKEVALLSASALPGGGVSRFAISPGGASVIFTGMARNGGVAIELYSVPIGGGAHTTLSGSVTAGGGVETFAISPDGSRVVFTGSLESTSFVELYSAPISGGTRTTLSGAMAAGGFVATFAISPNGERVAFRARLQSAAAIELFSAPIAGGALSTLSGAIVANGNVDYFAISPNSAHVVFQGDLVTDGVSELFSAPITGGARATLSGSIVTGGNVGEPPFSLTVEPLRELFRISPDSTRVVFPGDLRVDEVFELYSTPITGGARATLSGAAVAGRNVSNRSDAIVITPDSTRVLFLGDVLTNDVNELFSVSISGGTPTALSGALVPGRGVSSFRVSPDGSRAVFRGYVEDALTAELFTVPIAGGSRIKISGSIAAFGDVGVFSISPDSSRVVFDGDLIDDALFELFSVPIDGGARSRVSGASPQNGSVENFLISADGARVVSFSRNAGVWWLFRAPITGAERLLDFDGDDNVLLATDTLLLTRYQLGFRGTALTSGALGIDPVVTSPALIEARIREALLWTR